MQLLRYLRFLFDYLTPPLITTQSLWVKSLHWLPTDDTTSLIGAPGLTTPHTVVFSILSESLSLIPRPWLSANMNTFLDLFFEFGTVLGTSVFATRPGIEVMFSG